MAGSVDAYGLGVAILNLVTVVIFAYGSYWAFDIRKALAVRLYRNQALGIGLSCLSLGLLFLSFQPGVGAASAIIGIVGSSPLPFMLIFYWVDASVLAARRSDPLLRELFGWKRVRILLWVIIFASGILSFYPATNYLFFVCAFMPFATGMILLPISARRSGDMTLRGHLHWFGFATVVLLGGLITGFVVAVANNFGNAPNSAFLPVYPFLLLGAFCLYRAAKGLVPLNRISVE